MNLATEKNQRLFDIRALSEKMFADLAAISKDSIGITREAYGKGEQQAIELIRSYAEKFDLETEFRCRRQSGRHLAGR